MDLLEFIIALRRNAYKVPRSQVESSEQNKKTRLLVNLVSSSQHRSGSHFMLMVVFLARERLVILPEMSIKELLDVEAHMFLDKRADF